LVRSNSIDQSTAYIDQIPETKDQEFNLPNSWIDVPISPFGGEELGFGRFDWEAKEKIP